MQEDILTDNQIETILQTLNVAWSAIPGQGLVRVFETESFKKSMHIANKIAELAESQNHHPEIHITFDEVEITLYSHDVGGVTQRDIDLAQQIDHV